MGRKGGRGRGRGGDDGGSSDQYGESMQSQDKSFQGFSGGRGRGGGGDAGGGRQSGGDVSFVRHVPKFLQAHSHLLGKPAQSQDDPTIAAAVPVAEPVYDKEEYLDDEEEALRRAVELDPTLLQQHPELQRVAQRSEAVALKERGNRAFGSGRFDEAVDAFSKCIELDSGNEVFFSNRAAALTSLKRYHEAAADARRVVELKPRWAKGHSRLGAALFGEELFSEAREAYERALDLEPEDRTLQAALQRAQMFESRQIAEGRHKFKRKHEEGGGERAGGRGGEAATAAQRRKEGPPVTAPAVKNKTLLSFEDDEGE